MATQDEALKVMHDNARALIVKVLESRLPVTEEFGGTADVIDVAEAIMEVVGLSRGTIDDIKMWDSVAVAATKADLLIIVQGSGATILRKSTDDAGTLERPGCHRHVDYAPNGFPSRVIKNISFTHIEPPAHGSEETH